VKEYGKVKKLNYVHKMQKILSKQKNYPKRSEKKMQRVWVFFKKLKNNKKIAKFYLKNLIKFNIH
jgi:hypothetical protein